MNANDGTTTCAKLSMPRSVELRVRISRTSAFLGWRKWTICPFSRLSHITQVSKKLKSSAVWSDPDKRPRLQQLLDELQQLALEGTEN